MSSHADIGGYAVPVERECDDEWRETVKPNVTGCRWTKRRLVVALRRALLSRVRG